MFYLVDKPVWPSSNQALGKLKRFLGTRKAGHVGTLDPLASGLLLMATDGSTKLLPYLDRTNKTYEFAFDIARTSPSLDLGTETTDWQGDLTALKKALSNGVSMTGVTIENILEKFRGKIGQVPPNYSAIWIDGQRSYKKAWAGEHTTPLPARPVEIFSLDLVEIEWPILRLRTTVSAGTYVRSLARDIGSSLGGAWVVTELRRTQAGWLAIEWRSLEYYEFFNGEPIGILPLSYEEVLPEFARLDLTPEEYDRTFNGMSIEKKAGTDRSVNNTHLLEKIPNGSEREDLVLGYFESRPVVLLQASGIKWSPIRFGI